MNAMGHDVRTYIGVDQSRLRQTINRLVGGGYMAMGSAGMAEMGEMEMAAPDNTLPMMTGFGQFGPIEMGGMFSVVKVREGLAADDYRDPGWYQHPQGTVAYEVEGAQPLPASAPAQPLPKGPRAGAAPTHNKIEFKATRRARKAGHH
jgi:hypothetical protein